MKNLLHINQLAVTVENKPVVHDVSFTLPSGSIHAIMGPNGSGKSSLAHAIMGHPRYNIVHGAIEFDGKNIIAWGRASSGTLAVTYTWYYQSTGLVAENDTIFNNRYPWFWNAVNNTCTDSKSYDAQDILTHEIGHWMGLNDTYTNDYINNTMFGYGSKGEVKKNTLTTGDTQGVQAIYP